MFLPKYADFLKKNAEISKIKRALVPKGMFSKTKYVFVLMYQIQVSSITPTSFRQEEVDNFTPTLLPPQNEPLKNPPRLGLK